MVRTRAHIAAVTAAAAVTLIIPMAGPAAAVTVSPPIAEGLAGPLGLAVGSEGTVYVSQAFAGKLTAIGKGGTRDIATVAGFINGVAADGKGTVTFTSLENLESNPSALVKRVLPNGTISTLADLGAYEQAANPDQVNTYGFIGLSAACAGQLPPEIGPPTYSGIVESNPYAVTIMPDGARIVADAAGNDLVRVGRNGRISTVAVLPPTPPVEITAEAAAAIGLPACTIGTRYRFESVPTDVELGGDGMLYVSSLPGGPEDTSLGARGAVYRVNPANGQATLIASGFAWATGLAISPTGTIYVAELLGDRISVVSNGGATLLVNLSTPAAVEWAGGSLYATTGVFGSGTVVKISL
jgi:hypothetical protein